MFIARRLWRVCLLPCRELNREGHLRRSSLPVTTVSYKHSTTRQDSTSTSRTYCTTKNPRPSNAPRIIYYLDRLAAISSATLYNLASVSLLMQNHPEGAPCQPRRQIRGDRNGLSEALSPQTMQSLMTDDSVFLCCQPELRTRALGYLQSSVAGLMPLQGALLR